MNNEFINGLFMKSKQSLRKEQQDLQDRQAQLRQELRDLKDKRKKLRSKGYKAVLAEKRDPKKEEVLAKMLGDVEKDIKEIVEEYEKNSKALECYSKVIEAKESAKGSFWRTIFTGVGTTAAVVLGKRSLDNAYRSDVEGTLVNKKSLDFFNKLNPLKLIMK